MLTPLSASHDQFEVGRRAGEGALERFLCEPVGHGDHQHHGEVAAQDRHRRVLEVAAVL